MRSLYIGIGGGGDIVATLPDYLRSKEEGDQPILAGLTWKRRDHDPAGRPRRIEEFRNIRQYNQHIGIVTPDTVTYDGARHIEAHVSEVIGEPVLTIDISGGVSGTAAAIEDYMEREHIGEVFGIDVGGDVLCYGNEPTLRSPIADQVMLASLCRFGGSLGVFGLGADGELGMDDFCRRFYLTNAFTYATAVADRELALMEAAMGGQTESSARAVEVARSIPEQERVRIADMLSADRGLDLRAYAGPVRRVPLRGGERTGELSRLSALILHFVPGDVYASSAFSSFIEDYTDVRALGKEMMRRGIRTEFGEREIKIREP